MKVQSKQRVILSLLSISSLLLLLQLSAFACPLCKEALSSANDPNVSTQLGKGFYWSIITMLSMPFLLVAVIAGVVIKAYRRNRQMSNLHPSDSSLDESSPRQLKVGKPSQTKKLPLKRN